MRRPDCGQPHLSGLNRQKVTELKVAAEERLSHYGHGRDARDTANRLPDAIVQTEIHMEGQRPENLLTFYIRLI